MGGLVGRAFGFGSGDLGSVTGLCFTLRFLPRRMWITALNKESLSIEYQLSGANHGVMNYPENQPCYQCKTKLAYSRNVCQVR